MEMRPYQMEAVQAVERYLALRSDNPCVVLPTGSGKSYVIAEIIRRRLNGNPRFRCVILAHRRELVEQNYAELKHLVGVSREIGIYCASLERRDSDAQVIFAQINSVYRGDAISSPVDMIIVDEAHHIPILANGMYRRFIDSARSRNPQLRVVGMTATPYRLGEGFVCHESYVLNEVCYEAKVGDLIRDGYLCKLRSKVSRLSPDLLGVSQCGGDYKLDELSRRVCVIELVQNTVSGALDRLSAESRKSCVWFCVDVEHCKMVMEALVRCGEAAEFVTGETPSLERDEIVARFREGRFRHLLNVNVFTEGFNVKQVDAVLLLRPTLSYVLYVQMVGRGLRVHPDKTDCIVLDYASCIRTHGPIDQGMDVHVPMEVCPSCTECFPRSLRKCPNCGSVVSEETIQRHNETDEKRKRIRKLHEDVAALDEILCEEYACHRTRRPVNRKSTVRIWLTIFGIREAKRGCEYEVRHDRPTAAGGFDEEFIEYAMDVELTNLPDMLRDYFENENLHAFEIRRMRREAEQRRLDELLRQFRLENFGTTEWRI